jgi:hypothetical protein
VLVLFQDEARFGRMSDPARCWAPYPLRPAVELALVREFRYFYAAMGPQDGTLDWMVCDSMKTEEMSRFLSQVGLAHPRHHVVMVLDGASSHRALALEIPENISLIRLPPYSPELNPVEILWHELREKHCSNRVFETLAAVQAAVETGMRLLAANTDAVTRLSAWQWILEGIGLNAT